ncbi:MAG: hypothetical protein IPJ77_06630 [Planctomycetes bacterium]|nr:hypothetical protein [Planctomycetota bacterium]
MLTKLTLTFAALAFTSTLAFAQDSKPVAAPAVEAKPAKVDDKQVVSTEKPSYPLETCPISNEALGADAVDVVAGGHLVRVCCPKCAAKVEKDPAPFREKVVAAVIAQQKASYPLTTCAVTGEELGKDAVDHVYGSRLVRLKDKATLAAFEKDAAAAMAKVDKALIDAQLKTYAVHACPVTSEALTKDAVNVLYGTKLVRLCCKGCVRKFNAAPEKFLKELATIK